MPRVIGRTLLLVILALTAACGNDNSTPTTPTPTQVVEIFSGTLNPNGAVTHPFAVSRSGILTAVITAVTHDSTGSDAALVIGISLGTWNGSACQVTIANDNAVLGTSVVGSASSAGTLCVRLYDVGQITENTTYEVQVSHF